MNKQNKIIYFTSTVMLFIYILSLTPGLSNEYVHLFTNYIINLLFLITIIFFSKINIKMTLLLVISYVLTLSYIQNNNIENMKNIINNLRIFI
jgi:hypothetical protein